MGNLSDKLSSLTFTPAPQSPFKAGAIVQVASDDITAWQQANWFLCDGTEYAEADYAQLFTAIGSKYNTGGETASHFRVPNGPRSTVWFELTLGGTTTQDFAQGKVTQDYSGSYYFTFNISASTSAGTNRSPTITGISWADDLIGLPVYTSSGAGSAQTSSTNAIQILTAVSTGDFRVSGTIKLASKPSDTVVGADARFSTFDEALESQPMIKVYNDASNIAMSLKDATASLTGAVRLSAAFAAGDGAYGFVQTSEVADTTEQYLAPEYREESIVLGTNGTFTGGTLNITKIGDRVFIDSEGTLSHSSSGSPITTTPIIPTWARPSTNKYNNYLQTSGDDHIFVALSNGNIQIEYRDSAGAAVFKTNSTTDAGISGYKV